MPSKTTPRAGKTAPRRQEPKRKKVKKVSARPRPEWMDVQEYDRRLGAGESII